MARRRLAVVGVSAVAIFAAGGVLGAIADQAVPGDMLYSVDRAYEWVGRFVGPNAPSSEERLLEAITLIDRGREREAVELIDEAVRHLSETGYHQAGDAYVSALQQSALVTVTPPIEVAEAATASSTPTTSGQAPLTSAPSADSEIVAAAPPDAVAALRIAAEALLRNVQAIGTAAEPVEVEALAAELTKTAAEAGTAAAGVAATNPGATPVAAGTSTTTTSTTAPGSTTTATVPSTAPSTTTPGDPEVTTSSSTTSTTLPGGSDDGGNGGGNSGGGIIILPPQS